MCARAHSAGRTTRAPCGRCVPPITTRRKRGTRPCESATDAAFGFALAALGWRDFPPSSLSRLATGDVRASGTDHRALGSLAMGTRLTDVGLVLLTAARSASVFYGRGRSSYSTVLVLP